MKWKSIQQRREYYRKWRESHREELKVYQRAYYKRHYPECKSYDIEYGKNHRKEINARSLTRYYIHTGKLKRKPCVICQNEKSEPHHFDYNKPLEVMWFCKSCHKKLHLMLCG